MTHASTAALLRNAQLGSNGVAEADGAFAIDLSSRRMREASWLLDGVRRGNRSRRCLATDSSGVSHDLRKDQFIAPLRELAPLSARKLENTDLPVESIAANNVVDGLVLNQKWLNDKSAVMNQLASAGATGDDLTKLGRELDGLADSIDAVSDALTAETAYQMVRGNTSRLASTLNAVATGDAPAPELEVARHAALRHPPDTSSAAALQRQATGCDRLGRCEHFRARHGRTDAQFVGGQAARQPEEGSLHGRDAR